MQLGNEQHLPSKKGKFEKYQNERGMKTSLKGAWHTPYAADSASGFARIPEIP